MGLESSEEDFLIEYQKHQFPVRVCMKYEKLKSVNILQGLPRFFSLFLEKNAGSRVHLRLRVSFTTANTNFNLSASIICNIITCV